MSQLTSQRRGLLRGLPIEVAVVSAVAFCVALGFGILGPAIPVFAKTFGVSDLAASAVVSVFAFVRFACAPIAGGLINKLNERLVLASGLIIVALSSASAGLSHSYWQLIVLRGVGGLGSVMFTVSALALLLRTVDDSQRGVATSAYQGGFLFGGIAGPIVGGFVVSFSLRAPFFVYAATLTAATIVTLVFLSESKLHDKEQQVSHGKADETEGLGQALRHRGYRAALSVNLVTGMVTLGMRTATIPLFVTEAMHRTASWTSIGYLIAAALQAILLLPAGRMADTVGRRRAMAIGTTTLTIGVTILMLSGFAAHDINPAGLLALLLFFGGMALQGAASAYLSSAPAAVVGDIVEGRRGGTVVSTFQMMSDFGQVIGPLAAGLLIDSFGFSWAFVFAGLLSLISVIMVSFMPETLRRRSA